MTTQRIDGALLLTGEHIDIVRYAVRVAVAARHRNGLPVPNALTELAGAVADPGQTDTPVERTQHPETQPDWVDTREAAQMLGCSYRQARRLAPRLDGQLTAGRWLIPRHAIAEHLEGK